MALLGAGVSAPAQEPQVQISAFVDVVRLSVGVVHTTGGEIPPLSLEDFTVYDNGVRQRLQLLQRPEDTPLRVALVLDNSPSVRPWWPTVQRTAVTFLSKLGRMGCPYVLPFSDGYGPGRWGRYTANNWRSFLDRAPRGGGTSLHDALIIALEQLDLADEMAIEASAPLRLSAEPEEEEVLRPQPHIVRDPASFTRAELMASLAEVLSQIRTTPQTHLGDCDLRYVPSEAEDPDAVGPPEDESIKAVLLMSDGADTTSVASTRDAINAARLANVPVFPVMLGSASRDRQLAALLEEIARSTGGLVIRDVAPGELGAAYDRVLAYLGATYVLAYTPDETGQGRAAQSDGSWHDVRVELRRPLLEPIVRLGYYR